MPSYPSTISGPHAQGFKLAPKKTKQEMLTDSGHIRVRRYNSTNLYVVGARFDFGSKTEFDAFLRWLKYETNYGNLWFNADWFEVFGFTAGEWVFRFTRLPFSAKGYELGFNSELIMAPKNDNLADPYIEKGVGGSYIDMDYPFDYTIFTSCVELDFYRIAYADQDNFLRVFDWNGSNFTKVGTDYTLPAFGTFGLAYLSSDLVAYVDRNSTGTGNYGGPGANLQAYSFNDDVWVAVGTPILIGAGDSVDYVCVTALSSSRVAVCYGRTPFFGDRDVKLATYDWSGSSWVLNGSVFTVAALGNTPTITRLSATRVALSYRVASGTTKVGAFDFIGSSWSLTGTLFSSATLSTFPSISAMSATKIVFADANYTLRTLTFNGSAWTLEAGNFPTAGDNVTVIDSDKVAVVHASLGKITMFQLVGAAWSQLGNEFYDNVGTGYPKICSNYEF